LRGIWDFLGCGGTHRIDESTDVWADPFDFTQAPRQPVLLPINPPTDSPSIPAHFIGLGSCVGCTATQDPNPMK
jgi:hypothetical protein